MASSEKPAVPSHVDPRTPARADRVSVARDDAQYDSGAEKVHLLSRVMSAAKGKRIVLIVDEVGFGHRLVIENVSDPRAGSAEQCEANR